MGSSGYRALATALALFLLIGLQASPVAAQISPALDPNVPVMQRVLFQFRYEIDNSGTNQTEWLTAQGEQILTKCAPVIPSNGGAVWISARLREALIYKDERNTGPTIFIGGTLANVRKRLADLEGAPKTNGDVYGFAGADSVVSCFLKASIELFGGGTSGSTLNLGPRVAQTLAIDGSPTGTFYMPPQTRPDRQTILMGCEQLLNSRTIFNQTVAETWAYQISGAITRLAMARQGNSRSLTDELSKWEGWARNSGTLDDQIVVCFYRGALALSQGNPPSPTAAPPPPRVAPSPAPAPAPAPPPPVATPWGEKAQAALVAVMDPNTPELTAEQATGQRRAEQFRTERQAFDAMRGRKLHNRANDASQCLKVEPTGVTQEWGIEGRYRILNTCSYPVEASWCASIAECSGPGGNLWTVRPNGSWPIFGSDPVSPSIRIGGCRVGEGRAPPLGEQPEVARTGGVNEARQVPVPAAGVGLLDSHRCD